MSPAGLHASIWRFRGDPDTLLASYDGMRSEIDDARFVLHACLRGADGIVVVDTCPSKEAFDEFQGADWFREALVRHGLPVPEIVDYPVHVALAGGRRLTP